MGWSSKVLTLETFSLRKCRQRKRYGRMQEDSFSLPYLFLYVLLCTMGTYVWKAVQVGDAPESYQAGTEDCPPVRL